MNYPKKAKIPTGEVVEVFLKAMRNCNIQESIISHNLAVLNDFFNTIPNMEKE